MTALKQAATSSAADLCCGRACAWEPEQQQQQQQQQVTPTSRVSASDILMYSKVQQQCAVRCFNS
jgi:hypothetical protein